MAAEKSNPTVHIKKSRLRAMQRDVADTSYKMALSVILLAVRDEFRFGGVRLKRLLDRANRTAEQLTDGAITFNEILGALHDEGIDVGFKETERDCLFDPHGDGRIEWLGGRAHEAEH